MPGGNFLTGRLEKDLASLKRRQTPTIAFSQEEADDLIARGFVRDKSEEGLYFFHDPINKWVDSNLSNYIKKQMGTPDDPVRKLAEEGITHKRNLLDEYPLDAEGVKSERKAAGFPEEGMAQSPMAKAWERASDESLATHRAGDIQEMPDRFTKSEEAKAKMVAARDELDKKFMKRLEDSGLDHNEVASLLSKTPYTDKARIIGDTAIWEQEPLKGLARDNQLMAFKHEGFWQPMDTLRDKHYLEELIETNKAPWKIWED